LSIKSSTSFCSQTYAAGCLPLSAGKKVKVIKVANNTVLSGPYNNPLFAAGGGSTPLNTRKKPGAISESKALIPPKEKTLCSDCLAIDIYRIDAQWQRMGQGWHNIEKYTRARGYDLTGVKDQAQSFNLKRNYAALDKSPDACPLCALSRDELLAHGHQPRGWLESIFQKEEPVAPMAACTYHRQNGKRHALWHNNTPSLYFFCECSSKE
jgi:hypothetical protein